MKPLSRSILVGLILFAAGLVGLFLGQAAPAAMLTVSKGTIGGVIGLVSLLLALVLGFLVYTAFAIFATQQSEAYSLGPVIADIDLALAQYGPEAAGGRAGLRASLRRTRTRFFDDPIMGRRPSASKRYKRPSPASTAISTVWRRRPTGSGGCSARPGISRASTATPR